MLPTTVVYSSKLSVSKIEIINIMINVESVASVDLKNSSLVHGEKAFAKIVSENGNDFYMTECELEIDREANKNDPKYFCLAE